MAPAISEILDQPLPGEGLDVGDIVSFRQGDEANTRLTGRVTRAPWGSRKQNVSLRTIPDERMFVRLVASVELIEKAPR